jgi:hypothetical protein
MDHFYSGISKEPITSGSGQAARSRAIGFLGLNPSLDFFPPKPQVRSQTKEREPAFCYEPVDSLDMKLQELSDLVGSHYFNGKPVLHRRLAIGFWSPPLHRFRT